MSIWRSDFPKSTNPLRFFFFASQPHWLAASIALACVVVGGSLYSAGVSYSFKLIVDAVSQLGSGGTYDAVVWAAIVYIAVTTVANLLWRGSGYGGSFWATGARATARYVLTAYVTKHSRTYFSDRFAGSIANKVSHASNGVRDFVDYVLWDFGTLVVYTIASFIIAFITSPMLGGIFFVWVVVVVAVNMYFGRKRVPLATRSQAAETILSGATVDLLSNVTAMQEYVRRTFEIDRIKTRIEQRRTLGLRSWHFGEHVLTGNGLVQAVFAAAMVLFAIKLASQGVISAGDVVLILTIIFRVEEQFIVMGQYINRFSETWGEIRDSLDEILEPHEILDAAGAAPLAVAGGALAFEGVTFLYGGSDREVMRDFSLDIPARQKVGLVGKSGAGKSTLVKLLLRHYDVNNGAITIDGQDIAKVTQDSLREAVAVVPQEPLLFHRTLRENIAYGNPNASEDDIARAAKLAQAHDFIATLPASYETLVGERGVKLSGGERQRVAIARAILKNAPVLILDEATAALDSESEVAIQKALHELMQGKTVIAIAHRLSTLREMDRIIVMEEGKITEEGTHAELLQMRGAYAELWNHQAGGFIHDEEA